MNEKVFERTCTVCGLYFSSQTMMKKHMAALHEKHEVTMVCRRVRPFKIIQFRDTETLCVVNSEDETAEWIDVESIDIDCLSEENNSIDKDEGFPMIENLSQWVASPWEDTQ